jgi:dipeptidyl aminopeptidase/acylaminoacyl peptidase
MRRGKFDADLGRRLREAPVPADPDADARVLELALARHAGRRATRRSPLPRLAAVLAVALALGALLLTPAWAAVRDWVGDALESTPTPGSPTGLGSIPGGGRLLVQTRAGAWVVEPDGARHLLRGYREASWSPHGLYLAAVRGDRLTAVEGDGEPHWTLRASEPIHDPRWSPTGELVAYRRGESLRAVAGDGSEERALDESVAPVAPAWDPAGLPDLAYVDARGALRVLDAASGKAAATAGALPGILDLEWAGSDGATQAGHENAAGREPAGGDGGIGELLEVSARRLRIRAAGVGTAAHARLGRPRELRVAPGETVRAAELAPDGRTVAALLVRRSRRPGHARLTDLVLYSARTGTARRLGSVPGDVTEVAWSPRGGRLLVAWPSFDEWLFVPPRAAGGRAMTGIAAAFGAAGAANFPALSGWCCRARSAAAP